MTTNVPWLGTRAIHRPLVGANSRMCNASMSLGHSSLVQDQQSSRTRVAGDRAKDTLALQRMIHF